MCPLQRRDRLVGLHHNQGVERGRELGREAGRDAPEDVLARDLFAQYPQKEPSTSTSRVRKRSSTWSSVTPTTRAAGIRLRSRYRYGRRGPGQHFGTFKTSSPGPTDAPDAKPERIGNGEVRLQNRPDPSVQREHAPLRARAVGAALPVDGQPVGLPVDVLAGEGGELAHAETQVEQRPDDELFVMRDAGVGEAVRLVAGEMFGGSALHRA